MNMCNKTGSETLNGPRRVLGAVLLCGLLVGCSGIERATPRPQSARVNQSSATDEPRIMRGTVAAEAVLDGYRPVIVRGYGLVVGLEGTGSRDIPPNLRAHMLQEMARHGVGSERAGFGDIKPEAMLDSENTAVVIVEAVIPPGAVGRKRNQDNAIRGTQFDVRAYADPRTGTTSLEGGQLYTTELRPGGLRTGGGQARAIAIARGPIFVNPFARPGAVEDRNITRTHGMILNGGEVTRDMPLKLRLRNPSHTRAMVLQNAINARFPEEPLQSDVTARGESSSAVNITVPPSYRENPEAFIALLQHTTLRLADTEAVAVSIRRLLLEDPLLANAAARRWQALGRRALPVIQELYDYPEELPRMAALRAGAKLDDGLAVPHLIDLSRNGSSDTRLSAINLLSGMQINPRIDKALRELLSESDVDVRLAAYEALVERNDPHLTSHEIDRGKFTIDVVPAGSPMIYITQFGQPRVVIFGENPAVRQPIFAQIWQNKLLVQNIEDQEKLEVFYRGNSGEIRGEIHRVEPSLDEFIRFLGHTTTVERPEQGLGLSYGETVGAIYQLWRDDYINADFKAEQDRILAAIMQEEATPGAQARPEFSDDDEAGADGATGLPDVGSASTLDRLSPDPLPQMQSPVPQRGENRADDDDS